MGAVRRRHIKWLTIFKICTNIPVDEILDLHRMSLPHPSSFRPELSSDRLQIVANWLLDEFYSTQDDLSRNTDSGYGRGCTTFDRQRNRIRLEAISGNWPWLRTLNSTFDLVFTVGGVPCRFSNDDPLNPTKKAVLEGNGYQLSFQEFAGTEGPSRFCFVIDRGLDGAGEPHVELHGFDATGVLVCRWISDTPRVLYAESVQQAPTIQVEKPSVTPRQPEAEVTEANDGAAEAQDNTAGTSSPEP